MTLPNIESIRDLWNTRRGELRDNVALAFRLANHVPELLDAYETLERELAEALSDHDVGIRVHLNEVEQPFSLQRGGEGTQMRRAWELGQRLTRIEARCKRLETFARDFVCPGCEGTTRVCDDNVCNDARAALATDGGEDGAP